MAEYSPTFITETNIAPPWRLCTVAAGAMLADKQTKGKIKLSLAELANLIGKGYYPTAGTSLEDVAKGLKKRGIVPFIKHGAPWSNVLKWGQSGYGMVVQGEYNNIDPKYQLQKTNGKSLPHAIYVDHISKTGVAYIYDPLSKTATMQKWPVEQLRLFAEDFNGPGVSLMLERREENSVTPNVAKGPTPTTTTTSNQDTYTLADFFSAIPPETKLDQKMIDAIMGDVPVDNENRDKIEAWLKTKIGIPINQIVLPPGVFYSSEGGWHGFGIPGIWEIPVDRSTGNYNGPGSEIVNFALDLPNIIGQVTGIIAIAIGVIATGFGIYLIVKDTESETVPQTQERLIPIVFHEGT